MKTLTTSIINSLIASEYRIELAYDDLQKAEDAVKSLDVEVVIDHQVNEKTKIITINPARADVSFDYHSLPEEFSKNLQNYQPKRIEIPDFQNSEQLYKLATGKKTPLKIINDKYSSKRGALLHEHLDHIEQDLRKEYMVAYGAGDIDSPQHYKRGLPDHKISQLALFDIISSELSHPATDAFFLQHIGQGTPEDLTNARKLTKLDELGIPLDQDDLRDLIHIRNAVMHFRVTTRADVENLLKIAIKMDHHSFDKIIKSVARSAQQR